MKNLVIKQYDLKDCGACCLLSIIKYYGGYIPLEKIKLDTFVSKNGTTAYHLIEAAKTYGFDAEGLQVDNLDEIKLPAIAHVEINNQFNHFVVIYKINKEKNKITIMDPAKGMEILDLDEFLKCWKNIIIYLYPNQQIPLLKKSNTLTQLFINLIPNEKNLLSKLMVCSIVLALLSITTGFYLKVALKQIENNDLNNLKMIITVFMTLTLFKVIVDYLRNYYENFLNKNIDIKIMLPFLKHLLSLPLNIVGNRTSGEIITRINEINNIKDLFSRVFIIVFLDSILATVTVIILYNINSALFFLLLIITILYIVVGIIVNPFIYKKITENMKYEANFNSVVIDKIDSFLTLKNINKLEYFFKQIEYNFCKYLKNAFEFNNLIIKEKFSKDLIYEIGTCLITSYGLYLIITSKLTIVSLITFNMLLPYFLNPIKKIIDLLPKINLIKASFNKINEFIALEIEKLNTPRQKFANGDIVINKLNYSYNNYNLVCRNLSLFVKKGSKVMFKGASGCGKSTVCKLIYRLYNYKEGIIKINDINILDYNLNTIRNNITYLSQKENLFNDTIYNNIVLDRKVTPKKFNEIAHVCQLEKIVAKKPLRYETMINNQSYNISGGERQRIILARALMKNNNIIILDEALSEVENKMETNIIKSLKSYLKDKTLIYVTHKNKESLFDEIINFEEVNHA